MTLKTSCDAALNLISGFGVPSSYIGSVDPTAKLCVALANKIGQFLERNYRWTALVKEGSITTVADQADYAKPTDFRAFANMSQWDRTNFLPLNGPTSPAEWQWLKGSQVTAGIERWFRVKGTKIHIHPTPTASSESIFFDYYSKDWITDVSEVDTFVSAFTADNDTILLDEALFELELRWRFLAAKGFPFEAEYKEAEALRDALTADDGGSRVIKMGGTQMLLDNVPEVGFGV